MAGNPAIVRVLSGIFERHNLECADKSALWNWATCRPVGKRRPVAALQIKHCGIFNSRNHEANCRQVGDNAVGNRSVEAGAGDLLNRGVGEGDVANKFMPCGCPSDRNICRKIQNAGLNRFSINGKIVVTNEKVLWTSFVSV
jgi:hypothetical protein